MPITELPHPSQHRSWVEVDLAAIEENVRRLRALVGPDVRIMPAVKADGYGHGAVAAAMAALRGGAERLAVASCQEGEELRAANIEAPIQILGASLPEEIAYVVEAGLTPALHEMETARLVSLEAVKQERSVAVHLKIDTGMGRLGILPEQAVEAARDVARLPGLELEGLFMHFAEPADEAYSRQQLARFAEACALLAEEGVRVPLRHAASSAATVLYPEGHYEMIRPGAALYGFFQPPWVGQRLTLKPAMRWRCVVIQLKDYPEGHSLGYSRTFTTRRPTRVAVLPVGYADGYLRRFSNKAEVLIHGRRAPVVGIISMDYAMVDATDLPEVAVGTEVTLLGQDGEDAITLEELAERGDTIPYVVSTGLGRRPGRCYVRSDEPEAAPRPPTLTVLPRRP